MSTKEKVAKKEHQNGSTDDVAVELSLWERCNLLSTALATGGGSSAELIMTELLSRRLAPTEEEIGHFAFREVAKYQWEWPPAVTRHLHKSMQTFTFTPRETKRIARGFRLIILRGGDLSDPSIRDLVFKFVPMEELQKWADEEDKKKD